MKTKLTKIFIAIFLVWNNFLPAGEEKKTSQEYKSITALIAQFKEMTKVQQDRWNGKNEWKYSVKGTGRVSDVGESSIFSEIECNCYEVTIELSDRNRAIVYYPKTEEYEWVANLAKNTKINFKGKLKKLIDWGFWISAYVQGE